MSHADLVRSEVKIFIDTEFIEDGPDKPLQLISLGAVDQFGNTFYEVSSDFQITGRHSWLWANVMGEDKLGKSATGWISNRRIADRFYDFVRNAKYHELDSTNVVSFWGYYSDYDWVVLCQLYGTMMKLPSIFPKYCMDLKMLMHLLGVGKIDGQAVKQANEHNALADALWIRDAYNYLVMNYLGGDQYSLLRLADEKFKSNEACKVDCDPVSAPPVK